MTESVEQSGLPMIDVPHNRDHWGPLNDFLFAQTFILHKFNFLIEFQGQGLDGVHGKKLELVGNGLPLVQFLESFEQ